MTRLETLEPAFRVKIVALLDEVQKATGRKWALSDGRRTIAQQNSLYAQGRTAPGKVVTNARGGQSAHNFGLAADLWPLTAKGAFDWKASPALFKTLADIAKGMGLTSGYYFKSIFDPPHVEDPSWKAVQASWKRGEVQVA